MKRIITLIIALVLYCSTYAQNTISLEEYVKKVKEYSYQLKMSKEQSFASEQNLSAAKTGYLPKISLDGNYNFIINKMSMNFGGSSIDLNPHNYSASLGISQIIYAGGAVEAKANLARTNLAISQYTEQLTDNQIQYIAENNYWNLAAITELLKLSREYVDIISELEKLVKEKFEQGLISQTDVLMIDTRLNDAMYQYINVQNSFIVASQNFNILMGERKTQKIYTLSNTILSETSTPKIMDFEAVLKNRPDYSIADMSIESQRANLKLIRSQFNPNIAIGLQGQYGTSMINIDGVGAAKAIAFAQLSIPIFRWGERSYTTKAAKAAIRVSEFQKRELEDKIYTELNNSLSSINLMKEQLSLTKKGLDISEKNLELNTFSYNEGRLTVLDVLSAQSSWLQNYTNSINANLKYKQSIADYRRVINYNETNKK